jgi:hypothetical protein
MPSLQTVEEFQGALSLPMGETETCKVCGDTLRWDGCPKCNMANYEAAKDLEKMLMAEVRRGRR